MSKLRICLSSILLATTLSTAAAKTVASPHKPVVENKQVKLDRAELRQKLAERRKIVIERFLKYREARVYPRNPMLGTTQHLWFDELGNLCAAATLIGYDWGREKTVKIGERHRYVQLAKLKKGPVVDWILTSGLTHHEIVAIQAPVVGVDDEMRPAEIGRLYALYTDVERQLRSMEDASLDAATDALMKRPDLARTLL